VYTHVKISQLVNKMCSQQACSKLVNKLWQCSQCCYFIKLLQGCHSQLVDKLLNCRTITSCCNNLRQVCWAQQSCSKLSTSRWQLVNQTGNKQCEHILLTSCWNSIATSLLQFVTTCAFLRVYIHWIPILKRFFKSIVLSILQIFHNHTNLDCKISLFNCWKKKYLKVHYKRTFDSMARYTSFCMWNIDLSLYNKWFCYQFKKCSVIF
jgi:hypothetical protein